MVVEDYYEATINQMESILSTVQEQLDVSNSELSSHKKEIEKLVSQEELHQEDITQKSNLIRTKEERIKILQKNYEDLDNAVNLRDKKIKQVWNINSDNNWESIIQKISASSTDLGEVMVSDGSSEIIEKLTTLGKKWESIIDFPVFRYVEEKNDGE